MPSTHCQAASGRGRGMAAVRECGCAGGRLARLARRRLTDWALRTSFWIRRSPSWSTPPARSKVENHPLSSRRSRLAISSGSAACSSALPAAIGPAAVVVAMIGGAGQQLQV